MDQALPTDAPQAVAIHEVDAARWPDLERFFESRGSPHWCWCALWRRADDGRAARSPAEKKEAMRRRVADGVRVGLLAYVDGEPAAWCSVAPRETFARPGGAQQSDDAPGEVWSLTCFFVRRAHRGRGLTERLIEEAARRAREHGASVIEAYPVEPDSPTYRFCGFVPVFAAHGFAEAGRAGARRRIMRRELG